MCGNRSLSLFLFESAMYAVRRLTLPMAKSQGGSSFTERTCLMTSASHNVAALSPEAFAAPAQKSSRFPCAPGYRQNTVPPDGRDPQTVRCECALLRDSTLASFPVARQTQSFFYPPSFTAEPAKTRFSCQGATQPFSSSWPEPESPLPRPTKDSPSSPRLKAGAFWLGMVNSCRKLNFGEDVCPVTGA